MRAFLRKYRVKFKSMNMDILKHLGNNNVTFLLYFKNLKLRLNYLLMTRYLSYYK